MVPGHAQQWRPVLLPARRAARRALGAAPARSLTALAPRRGGARPCGHRTSRSAGLPPCAPDGPERRRGRPPDAAAPTEGESGKQPDHPVKNVLRVKARRTLLLRSAPYGGRRPDQPLAEATPSPWPAGSRLWQALGFLACTRPQGELRRPTKSPRGQELTGEQHVANQARPQRRLRSEPVNRRVQRGRMVKDRIRLWQEGVRDVVRAIGGALHNFRVRLTPGQPMV
jgi:hypothetical protein